MMKKILIYGYGEIGKSIERLYTAKESKESDTPIPLNPLNNYILLQGP